LITTIDSASAESVFKYYEAHRDQANLHSSMNIRIFLMRFSKKALRETAEGARFALGSALAASLREAFADHKSMVPTSQIVPAYGEGGLDSQLMEEIAAKQKSAATAFDKSKAFRVYLIRLPEPAAFKAAVLKVLPNATFVDSNEKALPDWGDEHSEIILSGPDMGFVEDISLYSYALKGGIFRAKEGADRWLAGYMKIMDKEARIQAIRELHRYNLENGFAFPLFASPYLALSRKPWQITLPKLFANHPLWQIQYQP
jgi:hypothetical protein